MSLAKLRFSNRDPEDILYGYKSVTKGTYHLVSVPDDDSTCKLYPSWDIDTKNARSEFPGFMHDLHLERLIAVKGGDEFRWKNKKYIRLEDSIIVNLCKMQDYEDGMLLDDGRWMVPCSDSNSQLPLWEFGN
jgi:hypothetical protein